MPSIAEPVLAILGEIETSGNRAVITKQLDRKMYVEVNKVLDALGGKWNRGAKAHLFEGDAAEALDSAILTGEYQRTKQDFGQLDTPPLLAAELVEMADVNGCGLLEPSCGTGNIVYEAENAGAEVMGCEIDVKRYETARARCIFTVGLHLRDFLLVKASPNFDRVVMNPPFAKQADITHVMHAAKFLRPGGILVSVMSAGVLFRQDKRTLAFNDFVTSRGGSITRLPEDSFKESGTAINTVVCKVTL